MSLSVMRLTPAHAPAYRALMLQAYALHPDAFTTSATERVDLPLAWWEKRLAEGDAAGEVVLGAWEQGALVGAAGLSFEAREKARHKATLFGMVVHAQHRGRGLGRALVAAVLEQARSRAGTLLVQLTVSEGNAAAQGLYASMGFVPFGTEPYAVRVGSAYVAKVHMWCRLQAGSMTLRGMHHVALICSDYARSRAFYVDMLGLRIVAEHYRAERQSYKLDLALPDGTQLELFSFPSPPARPSRPEACGLRHLAFAVDDVAAWKQRLEASGVAVEDIRVDEFTGRRLPFADPDGLPLELYEQAYAIR